MNMGRLTSRDAEVGWDIVVAHLLLVQHCHTAPAIVRLQAAEVFDKIVSSAAKECLNASEERQICVQEQVLKALSRQVEPHNRSQVSTDVEIRQAGLDTLYKILEGQGHALLCGWSVVFHILQTACPDGSSLVAAGPSAETSASTTAKASQLVRVAFPSLQLICSDFLTALSAEECGMSIITLAAFGRQKADVNVALTVRYSLPVHHRRALIRICYTGWKPPVASIGPSPSCATADCRVRRLPQAVDGPFAQTVGAMSRPQARGARRCYSNTVA